LGVASLWAKCGVSNRAVRFSPEWLPTYSFVAPSPLGDPAP
jgi:hypothetical protein